MALVLHADDEPRPLSWRQAVYTALMRASLASLHNLDLHYHVAALPPDVQQDGSGQPADLGVSSVSGRPARPRNHTVTRPISSCAQPPDNAVGMFMHTVKEILLAQAHIKCFIRRLLAAPPVMMLWMLVPGCEPATPLTCTPS